MAFHRIKKYSRQIVCQDCVLSCQPNHIDEIPLLRNAQINSVSPQNQKTRSGEERSTWLERDLNLSGMLMCWHLWNSRSMPLSTQKKKVENNRRRGRDKRERLCQSLLTLRGQALYMAIEKYLLFLMPRETKRKRVLHSLNTLSSRRDRVYFSAFYVHTALGLCQYKLQVQVQVQNFMHNKVVHLHEVLHEVLHKDMSLQPAVLDAHSKQSFAKASLYQQERGLQPIPFSSLALSVERMVFPCVKIRALQAEKNIERTQSLSLQSPAQSLALNVYTKPHATHTVPLTAQRIALQHNRCCSLSKNPLSLHCPSVLFSPDIQDIAQSGIPLEGSLTLELS